MVGTIVPLEVRPAESGVPVQGLQEKLRIYARIADEGCSKDVAYILAHPNVDYMHHYLIEPLHRRGRAAMGINTRYIGGDSMLLMERVIQDIGVGVKYLRERGYKRVVFIANSGGGAIGCLYQAQAEKLTIIHTPDGRPIDLVPEDFPPIDAIALSCVHLGRSHTLQSGLDPSVLDERDWLGTDPDLDMFNPKNGRRSIKAGWTGTALLRKPGTTASPSGFWPGCERSATCPKRRKFRISRSLSIAPAHDLKCSTRCWIQTTGHPVRRSGVRPGRATMRRRSWDG